MEVTRLWTQHTLGRLLTGSYSRFTQDIVLGKSDTDFGASEVYQSRAHIGYVPGGNISVHHQVELHSRIARLCSIFPEFCNYRYNIFETRYLSEGFSQRVLKVFLGVLVDGSWGVEKVLQEGVIGGHVDRDLVVYGNTSFVVLWV